MYEREKGGVEKGRMEERALEREKWKNEGRKGEREKGRKGEREKGRKGERERKERKRGREI